jgi:hypothetical protein
VSGGASGGAGGGAGGGGPSSTCTEFPDHGCPVGGALERHRKVCAMLSCEPTAPVTRIHFGPEKAMMNLINKFEPSIDQWESIYRLWDMALPTMCKHPFMPM